MTIAATPQPVSIRRRIFQGSIGVLFCIVNSFSVLGMRLAQMACSDRSTCFHALGLNTLTTACSLALYIGLLQLSVFRSHSSSIVADQDMEELPSYENEQSKEAHQQGFKSHTTSLKNKEEAAATTGGNPSALLDITPIPHIVDYDESVSSPINLMQRSVLLTPSICRILFSGESLLFFIPAFLFTASNAGHVLAVRFLDPATFLILLQFRLLVTAILSKLLLGRQFSSKQWITLVGLTVGVMIAHIGTELTSKNHSTLVAAEEAAAAASIPETLMITSPTVNTEALSSETLRETPGDRMIGLFISLVVIICSSLAGVTTERLFKRTSLSFVERSLQLNVPMFIITLWLWLLDGIRLGRLYLPIEHFNKWTWMVALSEIAGATLVGLIVRYGSSLMHYLVNIFQLFVVSLLTKLIWPESPVGLSFALGAAIVIVSGLLYTRFSIEMQRNLKAIKTAGEIKGAPKGIEATKGAEGIGDGGEAPMESDLQAL